MGECPVEDSHDVENPYGLDGWELGDNPCDYFIVDDQYNHER
jgi:hypothetical protein